jgi:hypothetical protein
MHMCNKNLLEGKMLFQNTFKKSDFLVQLDHYSPVGFGRVVF